MRALILLCLVAAAYCNAESCTMDDHQYRLTVDGPVNDNTQIDCVRQLIKKNADKIKEVRFIIGDKDVTTETKMHFDWFKNMMTAFDQDDHVDRIDIEFYNVHVDDVADFHLDHFRSLRINLHHPHDVVMIKEIFDHMHVKSLERFTFHTNTETEPDNVLTFLVRNIDHLRHFRLNSFISDFEMDRDRFNLKLKDMHGKVDRNMPDITKLGKHFREQGDFHEIWILSGHNVHDFEFVFHDNDQLRKVDTNMDLTKLDKFDYKNVWLLDLHDFEFTDDHMNHLNERFPNVRLVCVHARDNHLSDEQKNHIKTVFKHVDRVQECRKY